MSITFYIIAIVSASVAILVQVLKIAGKMKAKLAWTIWGIGMVSWLVFFILGCISR